MKYQVVRIDEADFGCEGRPEGYEPEVQVTLKGEDGTEIIMNEKDAYLYQEKIDRGDAVVVVDGHVRK